MAISGLAVIVACTGAVVDSASGHLVALQGTMDAPASAEQPAVAAAGTLASADPSPNAPQQFTLAGHYGGFAGPVGLFGARAVVGFSRKLAVLDLYYRRQPPQTAGYVVMPAAIDSITPVWTGNPFITPGHVLVGVQRHGVYIVNCGDPAHPRVVGVWSDGRNHYTDIALRDGLAYVTSWTGSDKFRTSSLLVLDVSQPAKPGLVAALALPGRYADAVRLDGDRAFVANGWSGLAVVDISDPADPRLTARTGTGGYATSLELSDDHLFLVDGGVPRSPEAAAERENTRPVLTVLDVTIADRPVEAGFVPSPGRPVDLAVAGDLLYVAEQPHVDATGASHGGGLRTYGIASPSSLVELHALGMPDGAIIERFAEDPVAEAMATFGAEGLAAIALGEPAAPQLRPHRPGTEVPAACDVARLDDRLLATWAGDVYELDLSDPKWIKAAPALPGRPAGPGTPPPTGACALAIADGGILLVGDGSRLFVYDASEPDRLKELGTAGGPEWGEIRAISVTADRAFVAESPRLAGTSYVGGGLRVLDISDPLEPHELGLLIERSSPHVTASSGDTVLAADDDTLWVFGVAETGLPLELAAVGLAPGTHDLKIHSDHALVARGRCEMSWDAVVGKGGLDVIDLVSMDVVAHVNTASAYRLDVEGDIAYVGTQCGGTAQPINAIDLTEPTNPRAAGRLDGHGGEVHVDVSDGLLVTIGEQPVVHGDELLAHRVTRAWQAFAPSVGKGHLPR
jgi:hypothetical protein